jgi:hypothetical protein
VFPIPIDFRETASTAEVTGENPVAHNLEVFFYSATCTPLGAITGASTDEAGPLPPGTAFAVVDEAAMPGTSVVLRLQPTGTP